MILRTDHEDCYFFIVNLSSFMFESKWKQTICWLFSGQECKYICYFSCKNQHREQFRKNLKKLWLIYTNNKKTLSVPDNKRVAKEFMSSNIRISTARIGKDLNMDLAKTLQQRNVDVGVLLDESCDSSDFILFQVGILFYC